MQIYARAYITPLPRVSKENGARTALVQYGLPAIYSDSVADSLFAHALDAACRRHLVKPNGDLQHSARYTYPAAGESVLDYELLQSWNSLEEEAR